MASSVPRPATIEQYDETAQAYFRFHRMRFGVLLAKASTCARRIGTNTLQILDIGPGFQTPLLQQRLPDSIVNTLGFEDPRFLEGLRGKHYCFDLNSSGDRAAWPQVPPQDLIVMAEVLEHLHVPPRSVMECVVSWLRPGGELLLQTPNAVSIAKRLRMLRGYNPFMMPGDPGDLSGHVREYTVAELTGLGRNAGLAAREVSVLNYFGHATWKGGLYRRLCNLLPANLRDGITICYAKLP